MIEARPWRAAWQNPVFRLHFIFSLLSLGLVALFIQYFFNNILQPRPGVVLNDFVLNALRPRDWSVEIFVLIYAAVVLAIVSNRKKPYQVLLGLETYAAMNALRMVTLYAVTLEPPGDIIPLADPLMDKIAYGGNVFLKDLFFSGHTASLVLLFLLEERKALKAVFLFLALLVATLILWQHVHYTVDVLAAPFVTLALFRAFQWIHRRVFGASNPPLPENR